MVEQPNQVVEDLTKSGASPIGEQGGQLPPAESGIQFLSPLEAAKAQLPRIRQSLPRTEKYVEGLLEKYDGKIENVTNPDIKRAVSTYYEITETLSKIENPTYNTLRTLRSDLAESLDLFAKEGKILKTGEGSVSKQIYGKITEDFFEQLEAAVEANPNAFPEDMVERVKTAHSEWREWMMLENTEAAKWFRNNVNDPGGMLDKLLAKNNTLVGTEIDNLRRLLGDDWQTFQRGLINRLLERSMRGDDLTPMGLKAQLANVTHKDKTQLVQLFGEDTARILNEIAIFRERTFGPKGSWNTPYANEMIRKHLSDPDFAEIMFASGMMSEATSQAIHGVARATGKALDVPATKVTLAMQIIYGIHAGLQYPLKRRRRKKLIEGGYRRWLTEGASFEWTPPGGSTPIRVDSDTFKNAADLVDEYGFAWFYPGAYFARTAERTRRQKQKRARERVMADPSMRR